MNRQLQSRYDAVNHGLVTLHDRVLVYLPDIVEHKLDKHGLEATLVAIVRKDALGFRVKVVVSPQKLPDRLLLDPQLVRIHVREALQTERPMIHRTRENDVAARRVKVQVRVFACIVRRGLGASLVPALVLLHARRGIKASDDRVHLLDQLQQAVVGLVGREPQLGNQAVHLVHDEHRAQPIHPCLPQHMHRLCAHALDHIDDDKRPVTKPGGRRYLGRKVDVPRRVDQIQRVVIDALNLSLLDFPELECERHGAGLHRNAALLLVFAAVHVPNLACCARRDDPIRREKRVRIRRLAVVHMPDQRTAPDVLGRKRPRWWRHGWCGDPKTGVLSARRLFLSLVSGRR